MNAKQKPVDRYTPAETADVIRAGFALLHAGDDAGALLQFNAAHERADPAEDHALLYEGAATALANMGQLRAALEMLAAGIARHPGHASLQYVRSLILLGDGNFRDGWMDYERRLMGQQSAYLERGMKFPRWTGEPLNGKKLLVWSEQGYGDEIMFASVLPDLIEEGARITLVCSPDTRALFERSFPAVDVFGAPLGFCPEGLAGKTFDYESPLATLATYRRGAASDFPALPYLKPNYAGVQTLRRALAGKTARRVIGLSWRGGVAITRKNTRSFTLEQLAPLLAVPNTFFISLQHGITPEERASMRAGVFEHWPECFVNLDYTATLAGACDLVVSVCNTNVHLRGAMGLRVLCLAPFAPGVAGWRYGREGSRMPWYDSVRIFRQPKYGDWSSVIARVATLIAAGIE